MRNLKPLVAVLVVLTSSGAFAQQAEFLSIPSSGFTPRDVGTGFDQGYNGNRSGTARFFDGSLRMFAPVNLPDDASVTSLRCGGRGSSTDFRILFTLRRNEPQQENVDMATVMTTFAGVGFQTVTTTSTTEPVINNEVFNYYIVAALDTTEEFATCRTCSIGFCRIGFE
jgi:hypothetical protein